MTGPDPGSVAGDRRRSPTGPSQELVEIVGPHLRVSGRISLGRFGNLPDLVNHHRRFLVLHDATILDRSGRPTDLILDELVVNQDAVTFVGRRDATPGPAEASGPEPSPGEPSDGRTDRGAPDKLVRHFVILTPGHAITGGLHVVRDMTLANFVEATDPRFIVINDAEIRSLRDAGAVSRFRLLLVNRTQISALAESHPDSGLIAEAVDAAGESPARERIHDQSANDGGAVPASQPSPDHDARRPA